MARRSSTRQGWSEEEARPRHEVVPCALCGRTIPPGARQSRHHLVPKLKGGAKLPAVQLHQICHSAIHARFSETELARRLSDPQNLRAEPELAAFIAWVADKPDDFHAPTRSTRAMRDSRRAKRRG